VSGTSTPAQEIAVPDLNTLLDDHVTLVYESVDRIFLNGYVARFQDPDQLRWFLCQHRGEEIPRYEVLGKMTAEFVAAIERMVLDRHIPVVHFEKGQRKEAIAEPYFAQAALLGREGVVLVGIAQEKANVFGAPTKKQRQRGRFAATRRSAYPNHVYLYIWDRDFGPTFIKFCTFAPFGVRVCLNGHMWLRQHLRRSGHWVEALDNGIAAVDDADALRRLCRRFGPAHIQRYFDRWMSYLPNPFSALDRRAGYTYQLSVLQLEIARTEVFDRPLHGRQFFEEVIRQHIDLGRPESISLIFGRRIPRRRGQQAARTRVFTQDVSPNLHVGYRNTHVKQYWKLNRALRTETTFNDTYDFRIGKKLENLPRLIELGRDINRRLLEMERQSCRPAPAATVFEDLVMPTGKPGRRAPGLRFGDPRVVALFGALSQFRSIFGGFYARDLRPLVEQHLASPYSMRQMAYDLRRLIRKGLLERLTGTNRYQLTSRGRRLVLFAARLYSHVFCRGLARLAPDYPAGDLNRAWRAFDSQLGLLLAEARMAA
jgi:hypothetical protein